MKFEPGIYKIARVCHEANRAFSLEIDEPPKPSWEETSAELKESAASGVSLTLTERDTTPRKLHAAWMSFKLQGGWKYGATIDIEKREHPNLIEYDSLSVLQRTKDDLFVSIVNALAHLMGKRTMEKST
jgi:hypothetical protein